MCGVNLGVYVDGMGMKWKMRGFKTVKGTQGSSKGTF